MDELEEGEGRFLVYRSSAGSGKTSTLVATFLRLALKERDPTRYGRILAITFTNKAAKEMRERILEELASLARGEAPSPPTAQLLEKEGFREEKIADLASRSLTHLLHHYSRLSISTIDRFVHRIVQQFARELEVPTDFELVLEEEDVLQRAVDTLIARAGSQDAALTRALMGFASAKAEDDKSWHIEKDLLEASRILVQEEGRNSWRALKDVGPERIMAARQKMSKELKRFEERLTSLAEKASSLIEREGIHPKSFYSGSQGGVPSYIKKLRKADPSDLAATKPLLKTLEEDKWTSGKCPKDEADRIHGIKDELRSILQEGIQMARKEAPGQILRSLIHQELYHLSLLSGLEEELERIKEEEGLLLISDLDRIIADLILEEPAPFIYERIGDRYDHILFDEFQDTSLLQWQNLLPLVENSLSEGNTVMLVGDGKQAIYRWRNGDVEQFLQLPSLSSHDVDPTLIREKEGLLRHHYEEARLTANFRSAPLIVRTNNELFPVLNRILMDGAAEAGMDHLTELFESGYQDPGRTEEGGYVSFERLPSRTAKEKAEFGDPAVQRCIELIQGPLKDVPPSDIAILTRTNARGAKIAASLMEADIDVLSGESLHLDQSWEVNCLVETMRLIGDPTNEIAKLNSIRCWLTQKGLQDELHRRIAPFWRTDENGKEGRLDIGAFWEANGTPFDLEEARRKPLYRCVEDAVRSFALDDPASPYVQFFMDHVFNFSDRYGDDLQGFLEDWDGMSNKPSIKVPADLDAVRVMTVHAAKGLEFPYLILPEPEGGIRYSKAQLWVDPDGFVEDLPAVLLPMKKKLQEAPEAYAQLEAQERYRSRLDALNLLYVAMTRAKEGLFVMIPETPEDTPATQRIDKALLEAIKRCYGEIPEEGLNFGTLPELPSDREKEESGTTLTRVPHSAWDERIKIRFHEMKDAQEDEAEKERMAFGAAVHEALSRSGSRESIEGIVDELVSEGRIDGEEEGKLQEILTRVLDHGPVTPFFAPTSHQKVFSERELLTPDGDLIRPDRVLVEGSKAWVLEIKTGTPDPSHHRQLARYRDALSRMGYEAHGRLLYTEGPSLEELNEELTNRPN